ncbi:MAG: S-methyl-5-thioribose-1-phosphate isomerase [Nitrospira sp. SB0666_bin_27]|nr:S-methyl-5-thioribose-1-phosphate isomerase [Nitrospira sp. SB0666_bin_27]MYF23954.1 S-methyl-5-thioribose-1-phosphate isomerase [Nitrospira sp. SB0678_bin_10]
MIPTVEWKDGVVRLLDQSRLPGHTELLECKDVAAVASAIQELKVRGAPAIGVTAAMGVALGAQSVSAADVSTFERHVLGICDQLAATRPTAVNLFWALTRMKVVVRENRACTIAEIQSRLVQEALAIQQEDIAMCKAMGQHGAGLIKDGHTVLTHCNAGALATAGYGTALGVIRAASEQGKQVHVFANETRPVLQGARLTAWELMEDGIPVTLITDSMAAVVMRQGKINLCVVGADRIAANGDVANKIGTYGVAVLAKAHDVPFYVAAPSSTIDVSMPSGSAIPIEERPGHEVTTINGEASIAPKDVAVFNPAFDVTPAKYVTGIITEQGIVSPERIADTFKS